MTKGPQPDLSEKQKRAEEKARRRAEFEATKGAEIAAKKAEAASKPKVSIQKEREREKRKQQEQQAIPQKREVEKVVKKNIEPAKDIDLNRIGVNHEVSNGITMHPAIINLAIKIKEGMIKGTTPCSLALLVALKSMIKSYKTPEGAWIDRDLPQRIKLSVDFLQKNYPITTGMVNAVTFVKRHVTKFALEHPDEKNCKEKLVELIDSYIKEELNVALRSITEATANLINNGDTIMTYGSCLTVKHAIYAAVKQQNKCFDVIVVDSSPEYNGKDMIDFLTHLKIPLTYIYINAISHVMGSVTKVMLGGRSVLANGFVAGEMGCAMISLVASAYNIPIIVACETNEFSDSVQTDSFAFNGSSTTLSASAKSEDLVTNSSTKHKSSFTLFNQQTDLTPPEYVSMLVTEKGIIPCPAASAVIRRNYSKLQ